ncbi:MAG: class I SAM-dependent methyltransferase [candidate division WOR-3 bacterium]|jgi:ubiquinone/menaquinone biosynthesis C-methylase UbiE
MDRCGEQTVISRERKLREWFTHGKDAAMREIDGLDIGWGGSQRWVTSKMPDIGFGSHLDIACGYGTFLAQVGWRFPHARLFGLNIDYSGPHASVTRLLDRAGVEVSLVQADARGMPFEDRCFSSVSCFLGLQDIKIGCGDRGVGESITEAVRVLEPGGYLILVDEFTFDYFSNCLKNEHMKTTLRDEFALDVKWKRRVAEVATRVYSAGWVAQSRVSGEGEKEAVYNATYKRMWDDMEEQLDAKGFYVPFGPVRLVIAVKEAGIETV